MTRTLPSLGAVAIASLLAVACGFEHTSTNLLAPTPGTTTTTTPGNGTPPTQSPMIGLWVSAGLPPNPSPNTCANFRYQITAHVGTTISGGFTGDCANGLSISGNASGQLNGTALTLTATGEGTKAGVASCPFGLSGSGTVENNTTLIRLSYTANTCLGQSSGAGVLQKQ